MTTNVRDSLGGAVATDSRWSADLRQIGLPYILLLDDAGYEKIVVQGSVVFMFAGLCRVIDVWKHSIKLASYSPGEVDWGTLPVDGMAISSIAVGSGEIYYEFGHEIRIDDASFAGTGSFPACACWKVNKDSERAVRSAMELDPLTGGAVRSFNFLSGKNNLVTDTPLFGMQNQFLTRSIVMNPNTQERIPVGEALAKDDGLRAALDMVKTGKLSAQAPCDAVYNTWPQKEKSKLVQAMKRIFPVA
jgi:hypothetical protein